MNRYWVTWTDKEEQRMASSRMVKAESNYDALVMVAGNVIKNRVIEEPLDQYWERIYYSDDQHTYTVKRGWH